MEGTSRLNDGSMKRVLITGGAGFIGSRLAARLLAIGVDVAVVDNLCEQVHGLSPAPMVMGVDFSRIDVRDAVALAEKFQTFQPDTVVHLAAETGTAQSAQRPRHYCDVNVLGTANLLQALLGCKRSVNRFVLASTRAVYGEGAYTRHDGSLALPLRRRAEDLHAGRFDIADERGHLLRGVQTPEAFPPQPISIYGSTKLMQELLARQMLPPEVPLILRLQNVYGPGQSLRNPYTGVVSHLCRRALLGETIPVFEDGQIIRDFVYIDDVIEALLKACACRQVDEQVINIGSGAPVSLHEVARLIAASAGLELAQVVVTGEFRAGDVRHACADVNRARKLLAWTPSTPLGSGIDQLLAWARAELIDA